MCLGCACIDLLELRMAKQLQLLTEHSVFPDAWPAQSLAVPRLQLEQSPTRVWTPWLWVWCFLCLRNCLETCCVHNKDIVIINPMQLVPKFCACVQLCTVSTVPFALFSAKPCAAGELNALHSCPASPKFVCMCPSFIITFETSWVSLVFRLTAYWRE